jgi:hypothetical protein
MTAVGLIHHPLSSFPCHPSPVLSSVLCRVICRLTPVLVFFLAHRNRIGTGKPSVQIYVRAAPAAEWAERIGRRLATGRAQFSASRIRARRIGHGPDIYNEWDGALLGLDQPAVSQPNRIG